MKRIAVIGAGITGITTAYELHQAGYAVTVIDELSAPSLKTSFANGGQLSACNGEVWNHPSTIWKGLKYLFTPNAPLWVNPTPEWAKLTWFARFIANIPQYEANTTRTVRMAMAGRTRMNEIAYIEGIEYDRLDRGILHVYRDQDQYKNGQRVTHLLGQGGLARREVTVDEIAHIEPTLNPTGICGGSFTSSDSTGDIFKFTTSLAQALAAKGVEFWYNERIDRIVSYDEGDFELGMTHLGGGMSPEGHSFDGVVICAGVSSQHLARTLGDNPHIYPVKGYSITIPNVKDGPEVSILDEGAKIVTSRLGDRLRVAGTAEFNGYGLALNPERIKPLVDWVGVNFPQIDTSQYTPWAGLRPMTPSMLPMVGRSRTRGVYYNTGHGHLGWTLGVATAGMITEIIQQDK